MKVRLTKIRRQAEGEPQYEAAIYTFAQIPAVGEGILIGEGTSNLHYRVKYVFHLTAETGDTGYDAEIYADEVDLMDDMKAAGAVGRHSP